MLTALGLAPCLLPLQGARRAADLADVLALTAPHL